MCVIGIKYQFITLHDNTNIPCRLKKKREGGGGKCHKAIQQLMGHSDRRSYRRTERSKKVPLLLLDKSHSSEHENKTAQKSYTPVRETKT